MNGIDLNIGFMALVDSAPVIVAQELGFAKQEGLNLTLEKAPSWSTLRDMLALGRIEAAHMLAPVPIATSMGLSSGIKFDALAVLSVNGTVIGVSTDLAQRMRDNGYMFDFTDAENAGRALIAAATGKLRLGVPFPFSMHAELLYYWLNALGLPAPQSVEIHTVPPALMAEAIANGEIDAFCVGEPWGSIAVNNGVGELLIPGAAIWGFAPEKVLAARHDWVESEPELSKRLIRAVWRAGRWLDQPENHMTASEILARPQYVNVPAEVIDRALSGQIVINGRGDERHRDDFVVFHRGAAGFPWASQCAWIATQLASRLGLDRKSVGSSTRMIFRSDLYRAALVGEAADLPSASSKVEGLLNSRTPVSSESGKLYLEPGAFFDRRFFDPEKVE